MTVLSGLARGKRWVSIKPHLSGLLSFGPMKESSKTIDLRGSELVQRFLQGRVIDIGAGNDVICPWAEGFDLSQGDANYITKFRPVEAYDAVCSSHCLEHMFKPQDALREWWALVKPGGYLLLTVPDEDLYEQGFFPSRFNSDHKATFRFRKTDSWSPVSHDVESMVAALPGSHIVSAELQSDNYDFSLQFKFGMPVRAKKLMTRLYLKLEKKLGYTNSLVVAMRRRLFEKGVPIDQTHGSVLAQIQVVVQKALDPASFAPR
ncbi:methyltransferase domain-containing protein [Rhodoferax sp.]|uniref:class I SAM-dependent methyltransferase n=1 Tax=Rhodoferax sp. TaxID=50421 RepID=UPI0025D0A3CE|nr:methyltransferase domain-containing protein [Rhodoferax sp.]